MTEIACVVDGYDALGEACVWCPVTRLLWWVDILRPCLQSYDPANRQHRIYPLPGRYIGCAVLRRSGGLVLALDNGLHAFDPATGKLDALVHPERDEPGNRYNDGRCDRRGRLSDRHHGCCDPPGVRQLLPGRRGPYGSSHV